MSKDAWVRLDDTVKYIATVLDAEAATHIRNRLPTAGTQACELLSERLSLGWRGLIHRDAETERRRAKRGTMLIMILLLNQSDQKVQEVLNNIEKIHKGAKAQYDTQIRNRWQEYDKSVDIVTMQQQQNDFSATKLEFMKRWSVVPDNGAFTGPAGKDYSLCTIDGTGPDKLIERMVFTPWRANSYCAKLTFAPTTKQAQGIPMYFLPWKSARIVNMTLGAAADIFFTAAINGCSVFVEGPAATPTVYHAGCNPPWADMGMDVAQHVRDAKARQGDNAALVWRELFWSKSTITARNATTFGEVNKAQYVNDGTQDGTTTTTARALTFSRQIDTPWRNGHFDVAACSPWGCVFGFRSTTDGAWTFYLQENVTVQFTNAGKVYGTARVLRVSKFYPLATTQPVYDAVNPTRLPDLTHWSVLAM